MISFLQKDFARIMKKAAKKTRFAGLKKQAAKYIKRRAKNGKKPVKKLGKKLLSKLKDIKKRL